MNQSEIKDWIWLSSSSGETFFSVWNFLSDEKRKTFRGAFFDRDCGAFEKAKKQWVQSEGVSIVKLPSSELEKKILEIIFALEKKNQTRPIIFLCGYMRLLSPAFLKESKTLVFNTHPSLLPSYPGKAELVHKAVYQTNPLGGFSVHLVNEKLDGGPIIFSHPVEIDPHMTLSDYTQRVRQAEQKWLPQVWSKLLETPMTIDAIQMDSIDIRRKWDFRWNSIQEKETL